MNHNIYIYILVMAAVSYLIRSILYYVPYVTLAVMTFPSILSATSSIWSAWAALIVAIVMAWYGRSLLQVAVGACAIVFILERFL